MYHNCEGTTTMASGRDGSHWIVVIPSFRLADF
jgi:hypothetical protein